MVGCRHGAKNTLDRELPLLRREERARTIVPESRVTVVRAARRRRLRAHGRAIDGLLHPKQHDRARAASSSPAAPTAPSISSCAARRGARSRSSRTARSLPAHEQRGAPHGVVSEKGVDYSKGIAITSGRTSTTRRTSRWSAIPRAPTSWRRSSRVLTGGGGKRPRSCAGSARCRHPVQFLCARSSRSAGRARHADPSRHAADRQHLRYTLRPLVLAASARARTAIAATAARARLHPVANARAEDGREDGRRHPQSGSTEVLLNKASTAHILGGCSIGARPRGRRRRPAEPRVRLRRSLRRRRLDHLRRTSA